MTVLRALEIIDANGGETYVSFEAPRWSENARRAPFGYFILRNHFREWADANLPSLTEDWVDDGFSFISKGIMFTNKEDALMAYLAFR